MDKTLKILLNLIGIISIMTGLQGCATANENPTPSSTNTTGSSTGTATRTAEEAAVESEFQPLFDFLAAETKDYSNVESIASSLTMSELKNDEYEDIESYRIIFTDLSVSNIGQYVITKELAQSSTEVELNKESGAVRFIDSDDVAINKFVIPVIQKTDFSRLEVYDYTADHPETDLTTIYYRADTDVPIIKNLLEEYSIDKIDTMDISLSKQGRREYGFLISLFSQEKHYTISMAIDFIK